MKQPIKLLELIRRRRAEIVSLAGLPTEEELAAALCAFVERIARAVLEGNAETRLDKPLDRWQAARALFADGDPERARILDEWLDAAVTALAAERDAQPPPQVPGVSSPDLGRAYPLHSGRRPTPIHRAPSSTAREDERGPRQ